MNLKLNRKVISMIKNKILTATLAVGLIAPLANPFIEISKAENKIEDMGDKKSSKEHEHYSQTISYNSKHSI